MAATNEKRPSCGNTTGAGTESKMQDGISCGASDSPFVDSSTSPNNTFTPDQLIMSADGIRNIDGEPHYPAMVDPVAFDHKPTNSETGGITNRLKCQPTIRHLTAEQLRMAIVSGHTVCFGCFETCNHGEDFGHSPFVGQRLMAVDIDNTRSSDKSPIQFWEYGFLSVRQAINRCLYGLGQLPLIVYESFSSTERHPKFRLVIDLGEVITDYDEAQQQILDVLASFPEADRSGKCKKPDALFFGTTSENGKYWNEDVLRKWPNADAS